MVILGGGGGGGGALAHGIHGIQLLQKWALLVFIDYYYYNYVQN